MKSPHLLPALAAAAAAALLVPIARAEEPSEAPPSPEATPAEAPEAIDEDDAPELVWRWRRQAWYDYTATGLLVTGAAVELALPVGLELDERRRSGGALFDDAIRNALVLGSNQTRQSLAMMSNVTLGLLAAYPTVVDAAIVTWAVRGSPDVAWQMTMINLQSYALSSLVTGALKRAADRERPVATACFEDPTYDDSCSNADKHYSFPSGHSSMSFTGASLMCLHHLELDLYGGGGADVLACVAGLTTASLTGMARIVADRHYMTDVLAGAALGGISGGLVPWLLYYAWDTPPEPDTAMVIPSVGPDTLGLSLAGAF
ncbi:MAG: phosphatase PAP2 family protein [Polyangiaceae bacterium]